MIVRGGYTPDHKKVTYRHASQAVGFLIATRTAFGHMKKVNYAQAGSMANTSHTEVFRHFSTPKIVPLKLRSRGVEFRLLC